MKKLVCTFYYYVHGSDNMDMTTIKLNERDLKVDAINTLLNYLSSEGLSLKRIVAIKWR